MDYIQIGMELFIGYAALLLITKVLGKTQITQITPFDFISALILGELVGNAMYDEKVGIFKILFAIGIWAIFIYTTEILTQKFKKTRPLLEGFPSIVIHKGKINYPSLKKNKLDINQLQHLLRNKGIFSIQECEFAILEANGEVSVLKKPEYDFITKKDLQIQGAPVSLPVSLIQDGQLIREHLDQIQWTEKKLLKELKKHGIDSIQEVLYAEWKENEPLFIQTYSNSSS